MKFLLFILLCFVCLIIRAQDTIIIGIQRTSDGDILSKIEKFAKKSKDFKILNVCEKTFFFLTTSSKYSDTSLLIALEFEFVESEFYIRKQDEISPKCKESLNEKVQ